MDASDTETDTAEAPPLPAANGHSPEITAVPELLTSFIGREREVAAVGDLVARSGVRLLTLIGLGLAKHGSRSPSPLASETFLPAV